LRNRFASTITKLAEVNNKLVLLTGDIGNRLFDNYKLIAGDRYFNCGIAEANMTGIAAGLALSGLKPVTYTITPFNTSRCFEQIKLDICYHNLPVIIVGTGSGLSYANLGPSHHSCEDIAIMRSLPNMTIICPADTIEVEYALTEALKLDTPVYIRIGKKDEPVIHDSLPDFIIGKGIELIDGDDLCILSTGNVMPICLNTIKLLKEKSVNAKLISMHTVKPLDNKLLLNLINDYKLIVTVEEHSVNGGFGSAVAEFIFDCKGLKPNLLRIGTPDIFIKGGGGQKYKRDKLGISSKSISNQILSYFPEKHNFSY
jgi:transketolase